MEPDRGWEALLNPGKATDYFETRGARPRCDPRVGSWHPGNAWWCSEISRTIYRRTDRPAFFDRVGFREHRFFDTGGTHGALVMGHTVAVVVFRGTTDLRDWLTNLRMAPEPWPQGGAVHGGFARALDEVWPDVVAEVQTLELPVFVTGHSLGGALATLAAARHPFAAAYTFGAPRVGNAAFYQSLRSPLHRVVHHRDVVPTLPPRRMGYIHGGQLHELRRDRGDPASQPADVGSWVGLARYLDPRRWLVPHEALSDHAPVNYSAQLGQ